ncbi:MAG TPA: hypothetical protein PK225_02310 [Azonexus sp.]|nr:hypothetical protein [Azonexus sp.]
MKDTRTVLDNMRAKIPPGAKLLVAYLGEHGELRCAQANCTQRDIEQFADSLKVNALSERVGLKG